MTVTTEMAPDNAVAAASGADQNPTIKKETDMSNPTNPTAETVERYVVVGTDIRDIEAGRITRFQHKESAALAAGWLNNGETTPEDYEWVSLAAAEWVEKYNTRRAELAEQIQADPAFREWSATEIERGPWTMENCVDKVLRMNFTEEIPAFPAEVLPSWVTRVEPDWFVDGGGETTVFLYGREHVAGHARAQLMWTVTVTVEADPRHPRPVGTLQWPVEPVGTDITPDISEATVSDHVLVRDMSRVLADLADEMQVHALVDEMGDAVEEVAK